MADLLTTGQVQDLLRVDRTTIYRMVEDGRLGAIRVGKQWRFPKEDLERWLQAQAMPGGPTPAMRPGAEASPRQAETPAQLANLLPITCAQLIQDAFAEMLGVMLIVTDMQGRPVTEISNPCGFYSAATGNTPAGGPACQRT